MMHTFRQTDPCKYTRGPLRRGIVLHEAIGDADGIQVIADKGKAVLAGPDQPHRTEKLPAILRPELALERSPAIRGNNRLDGMHPASKAKGRELATACAGDPQSAVRIHPALNLNPFTRQFALVQIDYPC